VFKNFHSPKEDIIFIIKNLEKNSSLSHHITKEIKTKNHTYPLSLNTPSHTTKRIIPWKLKKNPAFLP
jgi:hypothetical protein